MNPKFIKVWVASVVVAAGVGVVLLPFAPPPVAPHAIDPLWRVTLLLLAVAFGGALGTVPFHGLSRTPALSRTQAFFLLASKLSAGIGYVFLRLQLRAYRDSLSGISGTLAEWQIGDGLFRAARELTSDATIALLAPLVVGFLIAASGLAVKTPREGVFDRP